MLKESCFVQRICFDPAIQYAGVHKQNSETSNRGVSIQTRRDPEEQGRMLTFSLDRVESSFPSSAHHKNRHDLPDKAHVTVQEL